MKSLKFSPELVPLVKNGSKTTTWRLFDDKNLEVGEVVELIARPELTIFSQAKITEVITKKMGELNNGDKLGHESFCSDKEMYKTYSGYYKQMVDKNSPVTIYKFKLLNK
jgi:hypothetical protein